MIKELKLYEFYYRFSGSPSGKKFIVGKKLCKYPERTKIYKQLINNLDTGFIHSFGYQQL